MGNIIEFLHSMMGLSVGYVTTFIFCYFGEKITTAFANIHDSMYQCDWSSFPIKIRKYMPTMLIIANQPVCMKGFANFNCTLTTYQKVTYIFTHLRVYYNQIIYYFRLSTPRIIVLHLWRRYSNQIALYKKIVHESLIIKITGSRNTLFICFNII